MATAKRPQKRTDAKTDKTVRALGKQVQVEATAREAVDSRVTAHKASIAGFMPQTFSNRVPSGGTPISVAFEKASYHGTGVEVFVHTTDGLAPVSDMTIWFQNLTGVTTASVVAPAAEFVDGRWSGSITLDVQKDDELRLKSGTDATRDLIVSGRLIGDKPRREREIARDGG